MRVLHQDPDGVEPVFSDQSFDLLRPVVGHEEVRAAVGKHCEEPGMVQFVAGIESFTGPLAARGIGRVHENDRPTNPQQRLQQLHPLCLAETDPVRVPGDVPQAFRERLRVPSGRDPLPVLSQAAQGRAFREDAASSRAVQHEGAEAVFDHVARTAARQPVYRLPRGIEARDLLA